MKMMDKKKETWMNVSAVKVILRLYFRLSLKNSKLVSKCCSLGLLYGFI